MATGKIKTLKQVCKIVTREKENGKKVGLITGCFDVLHIGHIDLFRFAKKRVDFLVVGIDRDETLKNSKGNNRPVNKLAWRMKVLSELNCIDLVFPISFIIKFHHSKKIDDLYGRIYEKIKPDYLITNIVADRFWKDKEKRAKKMKIGFLGNKIAKRTSSTLIWKKLGN